MKPLILGLDTTGVRASVALVRGAEVLAERALESPDGFAHVIHREIQAMLGRQGVRLEEIDAFAAASGPGSFTGVRVGLTCVKGLAEALGKPAFGVSNLQALARFGSRELRAALIDARRGEVYGAVYNAASRVVVEETVGKLELWLQALPVGDVEVLANSGFALEGRAITAAPTDLAAAIAQIAAERFAAGERPEAAALDANYVRRSDAELFWKE